MIHSLIIATKLSNFTKPRGRLLLRTLFRVSDLEVGIKNLSFYITELLQWVRQMVNTRAFRKNVAHWSHRSEKSNLRKSVAYWSHCCPLVSPTVIIKRFLSRGVIVFQISIVKNRWICLQTFTWSIIRKNWFVTQIGVIRKLSQKKTSITFKVIFS